MGEWAASEFKKPDGTLNEALIAGRETLYTGMNGQRVERLFLSTGARVIYKPLTNDSQLGLEAWVYARVLPLLPQIYPKLLAFSGNALPDAEHAGPDVAAGAADPAGHGEAGGWCLFEDLGPLSHAFDAATAEALVPYIAQWHALPVDGLLDAPLLGPKPMIEALLADVLDREDALHAALSAALPEGAALLERVAAPLRSGGALHVTAPGWSRRVLSHGDLHLGNYALASGGVKVLDWEHAHLNSPYWDLYHLIDLSHPVFPKTMDADVRSRLLDVYVSEAARRGMPADGAEFKREYALFAAVFSLWMLLLIEKDLAALRRDAALPAKWSPEQLRRQRTETLASFAQCAALLDAAD
ncbi:phosphotransferase [Paenibacillus sp. MWE-103]|uniref:Phosphotransferase n=1 Tax=Paenibacillus artemisiicola TaxID=1172618 RepID=A0ABS3WBG8_9BACL|nr:phosphotransferase [Paenibacillus artemisiicola]MBO7745667.1 phosphotransferase [Paenibacillus artemisiicola]